MLIIIDESVISALQKRNNSSEKKKIDEALFDVLYAQYKGRHIVTSNKKPLLGELEDYYKMKSPFISEIIHSIKKKFSTKKRYI